MENDHHHNFKIINEREEEHDFTAQTHHPCYKQPPYLTKRVHCKECDNYWDMFYCNRNKDHLHPCNTHLLDKQFYPELNE